jgi:hypothetical protein
LIFQIVKHGPVYRQLIGSRRRLPAGCRVRGRSGVRVDAVAAASGEGERQYQREDQGIRFFIVFSS